MLFLLIIFRQFEQRPHREISARCKKKRTRRRIKPVIAVAFVFNPEVPFSHKKNRERPRSSKIFSGAKSHLIKTPLRLSRLGRTSRRRYAPHKKPFFPCALFFSFIKHDSHTKLIPFFPTLQKGVIISPDGSKLILHEDGESNRRPKRSPNDPDPGGHDSRLRVTPGEGGRVGIRSRHH